jgi:arylsulfatase A-like enzyme
MAEILKRYARRIFGTLKFTSDRRRIRSDIMNFVSRLLLSGSCLFPMLALADKATFAAEQTDSKPNIVFFLSDDQLKADYGCYGNEHVNTPTSDKLAQQSLVFEQAFTGQAICAPSRAMLFTGLYPIRNGLFVNHMPLRKSVKTIADYLSPLGYEVVRAGKEHVKPRNYIKWTSTFDFRTKHHTGELAAGKRNIPLSQIDEYFANASDKKFCMFIASELPHGPYPAETKYAEDDIHKHPFQKKAEVPGYYENIDQKEKELEFVLQSLAGHGLNKNTLFIYAADHGSGTNAKYTVYDQGLNVPFMVRWPGVIKPGRTKALVSFVDIVPTFVDLAGGTPSKLIDGRSFKNVLLGNAQRHHEEVFGVTTNQGIWQCHVFPQRSIRTKRYHYIYNFNSMDRVQRLQQAGEEIDPFIRLGAERHESQGEEELYDTLNDPYELSNLAADPRYRGIQEDLKARLGMWMKQQGDFLSFGGSVPFLKTKHPLDEPSQHNDVMEELQGTIKMYVHPHDL